MRNRNCITNFSNRNMVLQLENNSAGYIDLSTKGIRSYTF